MSQSFKDNPRPLSLVAGLCFIVLLFAGPVGLLIVPEQIYVAGDPAQTALNIQENLGIFHIGITAQILIVLTEIILTAVLYVLLKPSSKPIAMMAAFARLTMTAVMAVNLMPLMEMAHPALTPVTGMEDAQRFAMVDLAYQQHLASTIVWQFTFAAHLLLLGMVVLRSTYLPRFLGFALILGSPSYLLDGFGQLLSLGEIAPYAMAVNIFLGIATIGEVGLGLWLLFKGVNKEKWRAKLSA